MKKLILTLGLLGILSVGNVIALKLQVYNAIRGHTPVAIAFASDKGHGVPQNKPWIIESGEEKSKDVTLGVSLAQITINGTTVSMDLEEGKPPKGAFWRLELTQETAQGGCAKIKYELWGYKGAKKIGKAGDKPFKEGLVGFVSE